MNSPIYNEWVEEERKEAAEKAAKEATEKASIKTTIKNLLELLSEKFDFVPKSIRDNIESINDIAILEELLKKIIKVNTLEDFKVLLEKAKSIE